MRIAKKQKTTFSMNIEIQTDILERVFILSHWKKCFIIVKQIRMNLKP